MKTPDLDVIAGYIGDAYADTWIYRQDFIDQYGLPPTSAAQTHHMRSIVIVRVHEDEQFELDHEYTPLGRVQYRDRAADETFLLRSNRAVRIEGSMHVAARLFDPTPYVVSPVKLLVYEFTHEGLRLSIAGSRRMATRRRLEAADEPVLVGTWPIDVPDVAPFDQEAADPFSDLGDIDLDEGASE